MDTGRLTDLGDEVYFDKVNPNAVYYGTSNQFFLGQMVEVAELNGNDTPDLILGAQGGVAGGAVLVFFDHLTPGFPDDNDDDDNDDAADDDNPSTSSGQADDDDGCGCG